MLSGMNLWLQLCFTPRVSKHLLPRSVFLIHLRVTWPQEDAVRQNERWKSRWIFQPSCYVHTNLGNVLSNNHVASLLKFLHLFLRSALLTKQAAIDSYSTLILTYRGLRFGNDVWVASFSKHKSANCLKVDHEGKNNDCSYDTIAESEFSPWI